MWDKIVTHKELPKSMKTGIGRSSCGLSYTVKKCSQPWWKDGK